MNFLNLLDWTTQTFGAYRESGLFALAFAESSFFPVPPDLLLIAFALAQPELALWFALIATIGSVLGGIFGYLLGKQFGKPLLHRFVSEKNTARAEKLFGRFGWQAVFIAGFTPVPYKVFTILSGVLTIPLLPFIAASTASRGLRFFGEAAAIIWFGPTALELISSLDIWFLVLGVIALSGGILYYARQNRSKFKSA